MRFKLTTKGIMLAAAVVGSLFGSELLAQNFTNNAPGTYTGGPNSLIRMRGANSIFDGTAPLGASAATRIAGTVEWSRATAQNVQPRWYVNLRTELAGVKTYSAGTTYISGVYTTNGGNRNYTTNSTTVEYDAATGTQLVAAENTTNGGGYYNLNLAAAGLKETVTGVTVVTNAFSHIGGNFTNVLGSTLNLGTAAGTSSSAIANAGTFNLGGGSGSLTSTSTFNNTGTFNAGTAAGAFFSITGNFTNNSSGAGGGVYGNSGPMIFNADFTNTDGALELDNTDSMAVAGAFTRAAGTLTFTSGSRFGYIGAAQTLLGNDPAFFARYGNLSLSGGAKTAGGNINVSGMYLQVGSETDMASGANDFILSMDTAASNAFYLANNEVRGKFRRTAFLTNNEYRFNNAETKIIYDDIASLTNHQLDVRQATAPQNAAAINFDATEDVNRRVYSSFAGTGTIRSLRVAYETADVAGTIDQTKLRFAEIFNTANADQKLVIIGEQPVVTPAGASFGHVTMSTAGSNRISLIAGTGGGTLAEMTNNSDILMTSAPNVIISVINGRWSNPATWDIGIVPTALDDAEVQTVVWTGIDQAVFGGAAWPNDEINGSLTGDAGAAANSISIVNNANNPALPSALVIGNQDPDMFPTGTTERLFRSRLSGATGPNGATVRVLTTTANSGDGEGTSATGLFGLWIRSQSTGLLMPAFGAGTLINAGSITNNGVLEIGE